MDLLQGYSREYINYEKLEPVYPMPLEKKSVIFMNHTDCLVDYFSRVESHLQFKNQFKLLDFNGLYDKTRQGQYIWDSAEIKLLLEDIKFVIENINIITSIQPVSELEHISNLQRSYYSAYEFEDTSWFNLPPVEGKEDLYHFGKEGLRQWLFGMKKLCEECLEKDFVLFVSED